MSWNLQFPQGFVWGAATASFQIEGAADEDGRGRSIWDDFAEKPDNVVDGSTGAVACDHYHRYRDDVALMKELNLSGYRFSIAWPRIFPDGDGLVNQMGLDFYDRLVDTLLEAGIRPFATLYHWDLPASLQSRGGWLSRETAHAFVRYADTVVRALGDRVKHWATHNEPWVASFVGNLFGEHAPGLRDLSAALSTAHHILLSHGLAVPVIRAAAGTDAQVGIVHNLEWVEPAPCAASPYATELPTGAYREEDIAAARRHDGAFNRWFLDPVFRGSYPEDMIEWYGNRNPVVEAGDMKAISSDIDFLGINYYTRRIIANDTAPEGGFLSTRKVSLPFVPKAQYEQWEVAPEGLYRLLLRVARDYGAPTMYITENGTPLADTVSNGAVHDPVRTDYIKRHLAAVWQAIQDGADVRGYFAWTLLDNFEWNLGKTKRFGLAFTDYDTQKRIIKDSGTWFASASRANGFAV